MPAPVRLRGEIPFRIDRQALAQEARIGAASELGGALQGLADEAERLGRPKYLCRELAVQQIGSSSVRIEGQEFSGMLLPRLLGRMGPEDRLFAYCATCGRELEEADLPAVDGAVSQGGASSSGGAGELLAGYWRDLCALQAMDAAFEALRRDIRGDYGLPVLSSVNPGSGDAELWPLEQLQRLFPLFLGREERIGVRLNPQGMILPRQSLAGLLFSSAERFSTCRYCGRSGCPDRGRR